MVKSLILRTALLASVSAFTINAIAAEKVTLQGVLTSTTCTINTNGGKSTLNVGVFNTKVGVAGASFSGVNTITSNPVAMPVALTGCTAGEVGELVIQGTTSTGNAEQNVFVAESSQPVGFMIEDAAGNVITEGVPLTIGAAATSASYTFNVGMATTTLTPEAGAYSAPILVAYIVN
ncbi:fimbrial protein [Klebsiella sp. BIGb0407]|uniref:fimbrial protein n=1 Tax=Klebsiella sp. BIGb0407 TaxID=2940603 RepID=UPI002166C5E2|nr:type 1 fimbrial protein [Klebsiella sp. BIGb0407]MCS3433178.1 hypothetical protein [Klebsiella sp. BIGb0407]